MHRITTNKEQQTPTCHHHLQIHYILLVSLHLTNKLQECFIYILFTIIYYLRIVNYLDSFSFHSSFAPNWFLQIKIQFTAFN